MDDRELEGFYTTYILSQFGVELSDIHWGKEKRLDGDEFAFWFTASRKSYVLIWNDYQESGLTAAHIKDLTDLDVGNYKFVEPNERKCSPSIHTPNWKHEEKFVGWFTLLELAE